MQAREKIAGFDTFPVEFGRDGSALFPQQIDELRTACTVATDLLALSHGWNNDEEEASELYRELLGNLAAFKSLDGSPRTLIVLRVYWPSKRFAEEALIPGGAASLADASQLIADQIDALLADFKPVGARPEDDQHRKALQSMKTLVPQLEQEDQAQEEFVRLARFLLSSHVNEEEEVLQDSFFESDPMEVLRILSRRFKPPTTAEGAASIGALQQAQVSEDVIAAGLGNVFSGVLNGARNLLNLVTYYEMKERAGTVGATGLADVLGRARVANRELRLHLCGHSFGGRLVTAAAAAREASERPRDGLSSMTLLQAAFSHNGFGAKFDGQHDGFFRNVLANNRMNGPIVVTHSKLDLACGLAYPIASRLRNQVASGLGDEKDPYGAIGRNGAMFVNEFLDKTESTLRPDGETYQPFRPGHIYNLEGARFITGHSMVRGKEVAAALRHAMGGVA